MHVFVAGATGALGRRLIGQLVDRGHQVFGLARNEANEAVIDALGAQSRRGDLFDVDSLAAAAKGCSVVIHAATAIPKSQRPKPADWALNDRIRREGTTELTECAARIGAQVYLQQSIAWLARPVDDSPFDEDSSPNLDPLIQSAFDGEQIAERAGATHGFAVGILRLGMFYAHDAHHTRMLGEALAKRRLPVMGNGQWALLHVEDAAGAMVAAAEAGKRGKWHVIDDEPVAADVFLDDLAQRLGAKRPWRIPTVVGDAVGRQAGGGLLQ